MAEKAVATGDVSIGQLDPAQTSKVVEFARGLQQSALEALGTTLDKKLDAAGVSYASGAAAEIAGTFSGMCVVINGDVRLEDGSPLAAMLLIGEDEAVSLFNIGPDEAASDDYKDKLEESVQTTVGDLADFLTLSVSVNSSAQLQFGISTVELRNLSMTPLELPAELASEVLSIHLPLTADGGPTMDVAYLMAVDGVGRLLAAIDPSAAPAPAASQPAPAAAKASASGAKKGAEPTLMPLPTGHQEEQDAVVRPAQFTSFPGASEGSAMANIDLILDVQLRVTVELGRKLMSVRDILALGPGSVVELDKLAGEPVDVLVNDRLIATGEVVVADDNFGVRITDIINPAKRLSSR
ncbi:MAG TPA: flagellar motor switch protein FliN [Chloroflexota bacterium]